VEAAKANPPRRHKPIVVGVWRNPSDIRPLDLVTYCDAALVLSGLIEYTTAGSNVVSSGTPEVLPTLMPPVPMMLQPGIYWAAASFSGDGDNSPAAPAATRNDTVTIQLRHALGVPGE